MSEIHLRNTVVVLHTSDASKRFQVDSVVVEVTSGRRLILVHFCRTARHPEDRDAA